MFYNLTDFFVVAWTQKLEVLNGVPCQFDYIINVPVTLFYIIFKRIYSLPVMIISAVLSDVNLRLSPHQLRQNGIVFNDILHIFYTLHISLTK